MVEQKMYKKNRNQRNKNKILLLIGLGLIIPVLIVYFVGSIYYTNHFYSNTQFNGINISNMKSEKAEQVITSKVNSYVLSLKGRNGVSDALSGESIDLKIIHEENVDDILSRQNGFTWPVAILNKHVLKVKAALKYDSSLLKKQIDNMSFFDDANRKKPVNARISDYNEGGFQIISEDKGSIVIKSKLHKAVKKSVQSLETHLSLDSEGCYAEPEITSENPKLLKALEKMNKIAGTQITYNFGEITEVLDGSRIGKWLSVDDQFKVTLNQAGVKEFVDYIGKNYNSFGRVRTFKTSYGKVIKVKGGDYGWWLNRAAEAKELTALIMKGSHTVRKPVYLQTAQQYGKDDVGNTYVEVNLTAQHMFFYKNGKKILDADVVTGNVSKKLGTPVGTYPIQYKESDATLVGEDYTTPVKWWMPFNHNIGLHDASWRNGKFGKDIYLTNGSHGCVNMPPAKAKLLFQYVKRGTPVIVYKLKGTENYDTKESKYSKVSDKSKKSEKSKKLKNNENNG